jgi:H+/Cl- antiporter ClcA
MKKPSEIRSDLIFIIFFAFLAGTFFGAFGVLYEQYLWDPNPKEGTVRCFIAMLLLIFGLLFIAITISRNLRERIDGKNKND